MRVCISCHCTVCSLFVCLYFIFFQPLFSIVWFYFRCRAFTIFPTILSAEVAFSQCHWCLFALFTQSCMWTFCNILNILHENYFSKVFHRKLRQICKHLQGRGEGEGLTEVKGSPYCSETLYIGAKGPRRSERAEWRWRGHRGKWATEMKFKHGGGTIFLAHSARKLRTYPPPPLSKWWHYRWM